MRNRMYETASQGRLRNACEALDVDDSYTEESANVTERHGNAGPCRYDGARPHSTYDGDSEDEIPKQVFQTAVRRMECIRDVLAGEKGTGVRPVECHPVAAVSWPDVTELQELK
jgi:hypothetical protein